MRNGIIFQQRDNIRYLVFGYAAKDILLLLIAVAAVAVLITVTSRSTTNPIRELSRAAREIAGGNYDVTVPERDRVEEFGELERNFNLMTAELRSNEYLRKDFISSVSHQLKTPLSILNGYAPSFSPKAVFPIPRSASTANTSRRSPTGPLVGLHR